MQKPIHTAIIPVAGTGARMLPAASTTEKCLMPLYTEKAAIPVIDFIVEDCVKAGLERVIFVTTKHGENELKRYFDAEMSIMRRANEHSFTDVVNAAIAGGENFNIHYATGKYLDCGEPDGAFNAMTYIRQHPLIE